MAAEAAVGRTRLRSAARFENAKNALEDTYLVVKLIFQGNVDEEKFASNISIVCFDGEGNESRLLLV